MGPLEVMKNRVEIYGNNEAASACTCCTFILGQCVNKANVAYINNLLEEYKKTGWQVNKAEVSEECVRIKMSKNHTFVNITSVI